MSIDFVPRRIILVHGTILVPWLMKHPGWIKPSHPLHQALARRFPSATIEGFQWRGGNLHADRLRAASELAGRIDAHSEPLLLVGHSHGGNVARMALQRAKRRAAPTALLTLATPFLNVRWYPTGSSKRQAARVNWRTWWVFMWSLALAMTVVLSLSSLGVEFIDPGRFGVDASETASNSAQVWQTQSASRESLLALLIALTGLAIALGLGVAVLMTGLTLVGRLLLRHAAKQFGGTEGWRDLLSHVDTRPAEGALGSTKSVTAAVEDDEAAWSLNIGQAAGSVGAVLGSSATSDHMHGWARAMLNTAVTVALAIGAVAAVSDGREWQEGLGYALVFLHGPLGGVVDEVALLVALVLLVAGAFGLVGLAIQMFEYVAAGWDSLAYSGTARFSVSSLPPGEAQARLMNLADSPSHRGLRHSGVYEDERVRDEVLSLLGSSGQPLEGAVDGSAYLCQSGDEAEESGEDAEIEDAAGHDLVTQVPEGSGNSTGAQQSDTTSPAPEASAGLAQIEDASESDGSGARSASQKDVADTSSEPPRQSAAIPLPSVAPLPPADWYADPHGKKRLRYWDGRNWTDHVAE